MSMWQLAACIDGWNKAQGGGNKPEAMSAEEFHAMSQSVAPFIRKIDEKRKARSH